MLLNLMLDRDGRVREWNDRARRVFGRQDGTAAGPFYAELFRWPDGEQRSARLLEQARLIGAAQHSGDAVRADGSLFPARLLLTPVTDGGNSGDYSLVVEDLTATGAARQRELDDHARFLNIIESAMDAIITIDEQQRIVLFNAAAEKMFGCAAAQAVGGTLDRFIPERHRSAHGAHVKRFGSTGVTTRRMGDQTVLAGLRADGVEFPIEASISQASVGGMRLFTVIMRDITERTRAAEELANSHRQLKRLYAAMHEVREAERTRIARELHDELAQWLTALKMDVSWLAQRVDPGQEQLAAKIQKMKAAVDTAVASLRRIAADLRPVMLDDLGLVAALDNLMHDFTDRTGIMAKLKARSEELPFREPLTSALYRMVQEALTNVARHAEATRVSVEAHAEGERLVVRVSDDGRGIRPADLEACDSYGLLGIRERAETLGGAARIYAAEEGGTVVDIDIPLAPYKAGEQSR